MTAPVLILGATGGVGQALARTLAARDVPLILTARSRDALTEMRQETGARFHTCDVLDGSFLQRVDHRSGDPGGRRPLPRSNQGLRQLR
jgi:short-subunit dehydrogenase